MAEKNKYRSLRGMPDILPEEAAAFHMVEDKARKIFRMFEFSEICTPILEETTVFVRSIGEDTDIVEKEMYSLKDRNDKDISLRPEGTASIIRAFIEHRLHKDRDITKLFYVGPMFRRERPQKGRLRQFHQIGAEIIGIPRSGIYHDVELIINAGAVLKGIGIDKAELNLNSLGCKKDREKYKKVLSDHLLKSKDELCENCQRRISSNVLRVLDCKSKICKNIVENSPKISDRLCGECSSHYDGIKGALKGLGIKFKENHNLVRGLDYYTGIIFEINHSSLGSQDAIAAGGRYDDLTKEMGGPDVGAIGYAIGVERALLAIGEEKKPKISKGVLVIAVDSVYMTEALKTVNLLRGKYIVCEIDAAGKSLKAAMRRANREKRKNVILIGEDEIKSKKFLLKNMETGDQETLTIEEIVERLKGEG